MCIIWEDSTMSHDWFDNVYKVCFVGYDKTKS